MKIARHLLHNPGFAFIAIVAIALGISTVTTMFAILDTLVFRPVPGIENQEQVIRVRAGFSPEHLLPGFSQVMGNDLRANSRSLEGLFLTMSRTIIFGDPNKPVRVCGADVTEGAFQTLGAQPMLGRLFTKEEEASAAPVALLSHELWIRKFRGDRNIVGSELVLNGNPTKIVGIMPPGFRFPDQIDIWLPWRDDGEPQKNRLGFINPAWARLAPGVSRAKAQTELDALAKSFATQHPETDKGILFRVTHFREGGSDEKDSALLLLLFSVIVVQLIACTNVANLLLARGATRFREMTIRSALGANRSRLIWQMLSESFLLGLVGSSIGILASYWILDGISAVIPSDMPSWMQLTIDTRVLVVSTAAALISTLLFGLFPAIRLSKVDLHAGLKEGGRGMTDSRFASRLRSHLVRDQLALAVVLLIFAGLSIRGFLRDQNQLPGIDPRNVFTFRVGLPPLQFKENTVQPQFFGALVPELVKIPGVETAALVDVLPMSSHPYLPIASFMQEGKPKAKSVVDQPYTLRRTATPGIFAALKIPLVRGRLFDDADSAGDDAQVVVVDEAFAREYYPNADVLGKKIAWSPEEHGKDKEPVKWMTIIGVVGSVIPASGEKMSPRVVWEPIRKTKTDNFYTGVLRVHAGIDPASLAERVQEAVLRLRQGVPIYYPRTMEDVYGGEFWERRFFTITMSIFAGAGVFLAAIGIYATMAYHVSQRRREIGVRIALGADPRHVFAMLMNHGARMITEGLGIGLGVAYAITWLLARYLGNLVAFDGITYAIVAVVLTLTALAACWLPSRKATAIEPMDALRAE
ncbi:MAG TPA: ABC transporter permease [Chthoniobacterales bacterium]